MNHSSCLIVPLAEPGLVRSLFRLFVLCALIPQIAVALNFNSKSIRGLSQAYGYVSAQELTIASIEKQYPELEGKAALARAQFQLAFPDSAVKLRKHIFAAVDRLEFDKGMDVLREKILANQASRTLTRSDANAFLDEVVSRSKGEIESPVYEYLLAVKYESWPAGEFLDRKRQRYQTDGTGKAQGIKLALQLPRSWAPLDGERPHIVKKWESENGTGLEMIALDIRDAEGYAPTRQEIEELVRSGEAKLAMPESAALVSAGAFLVEGQPGYWVQMTLKQERVGVGIYQEAIQYQLYFRGKAIGILCSALGPPENTTRVSEAFVRIRPLCQQVVNSLVLLQKY